MARIPEAEIERIKRETDLKALIESYGVKLEPRGKDYAGLCPMHNDTSPSLLVNTEKNLWHCLGACQTGGTVFDWVMNMERVSFWHAFKRLQNPNRDPLQAISRQESFQCDVPDDELLRQVIDYYHATLKDSPDVLNYLQKRKLMHPELIDHFKLGYANKSLCYLLPKSWLKAGTEVRLRLQELGLIRESSHEHLAGCLVIPVIDENGQISEVYGRRVERKIRKGATPHVYLPGAHRGVFNIRALQASREIILCEALIDALTFWCYDFRNVTAAYGVNGFTQDYFEAFKKYKIEKVLIAYDHDEAGDMAAEKLAEKLTACGMSCFRLRFPLGMDVNLFAQCSGQPETDLKHVISAAAPFHQAAVFGSGRPDNVVSEPWSGVDRRDGPYSTETDQKPLPDRDEPAPCRHPLPATILAAKNKLDKPPEEYQSGEAAADEQRPAADSPAGNFPLEIKKEEITITLGDRRWRVRGLYRNMSYDQLRVNVMVLFKDRFFVDTLDLYSSRLRSAFVKQAAVELETGEEIIKTDLSRVFLKLEELQDEHIKQVLSPKKEEIVLSESERREALAFLEDPRLLSRILEDFEKCGVVGEEINKLVGYLAAVSRKQENPLAVIVQSSSAAGKTWLMESVLSFMPEEEKLKYSAMTGQSLYYLGEKDLKHKILAIVEEEGAEKASYALKLLQSEGELSIASTGKDPQTGKLVTHEYNVQGPVMIFITTTGIDIDEELQNRCLILTVNESRDQTRAIHQQQRLKRTLPGLREKRERSAVLKLHRNAQRLLRPLPVINQYAPQLTFLDDRTRTRRDNDKYLNLIEAIALLHQYQRPVKRMMGTGGGNGQPEEYIEVDLSDIETANQLAGEVLGRSLDELPPQTRQLLYIIEQYVTESCRQQETERPDFRFSRRSIREYCHWSNTRLVKHLERLEELEYLLIHRGGRGQSFVYELLYEGNGKDGKPFMMGLIDVEKLGKPVDSPTSHDSHLTPPKGNLTPQTHRLTPSKHPQNTGESPQKHPADFSPLAAADNDIEQRNKNNEEKTLIEPDSFSLPLHRGATDAAQPSSYHSYLAAKEKEFARPTAGDLPGAVPGNGRK
jgi:DNA primase catalytic core